MNISNGFAVCQCARRLNLYWYIGCDVDGNVIGLPNARKLLDDVPDKIRDDMGIDVGVNLYEENGKEYIEIDVPSYPIGIPCKRVYYYRSGSSRQISNRFRVGNLFDA